MNILVMLVLKRMDKIFKIRYMKWWKQRY